MGSVQALPHLRRDRLPGAASVPPCGGHRAHDGAGVVAVEREDASDGGGGRTAAGTVGTDAHDLEQRSAGGGLVDPPVLEQQVVVHVEDPGGVLGPLVVAPHPVEGLGDAAQHGPALDCCCCAAPSVLRPRPTAAASVGGRDHTAPGWRAPAATSRSSASPDGMSTHVSFEPPPWLEFTTRLPSCNATRVSPPGDTQRRFPSFTANGRRSTCRGANPSPVWVGEVESCTISWAIHPRGFWEHLAPQLRSICSSDAGGTDHDARSHRTRRPV